MENYKRLKFVILIYIVAVILLTILGIIGNTDDNTIKSALKYFSLTEIETGKSRFIYGLIPYTLSRILTILLLLFFLIKKYNISLSDWICSKIDNKFLQILVSFLIIFISLRLFRIPIDIFAGFYRGKLFGLINSDFITWFSRYLLSSFISILFISLAISIFLYIIKRVKRYYFYIPIAFMLMGIFISVIYPRFITPMFYETVSIKNSELKEKIQNLALKADVNIKDISVINKSRYGNSVNAYLVGMGSERKIVLYDTLVNNFSDDEILSVVAHEMGHYVEEHMFLGIFAGSIGILFALFIIGQISKFIFNRDKDFFLHPEGHIPFMIILILMFFVSKPVENSISRVIERRADSYSLKYSGKPSAFIDMEKKLSINNKSNVLPHPVFVWFYHSHPPVLERIRSAGER